MGHSHARPKPRKALLKAGVDFHAHQVQEVRIGVLPPPPPRKMRGDPMDRLVPFRAARHRLKEEESVDLRAALMSKPRIAAIPSQEELMRRWELRWRR